MFSLPLGIDEKKGTNPDLEMKSSDIDYGYISYFLPKTKTPCGYRLIAAGEVVGCVVQSVKRKNSVITDTMSPSDRYIVHQFLNSDPRVSTSSIGKGHYKRVRINFEK